MHASLCKVQCQVIGKSCLLAQVIDEACPLLQGLVVGVNAESKLGVALRVLMSTEDLGTGWQGFQLGEGGPHLLCIAFEHAATAQRKECVTCMHCTSEALGSHSPCGP